MVSCINMVKNSAANPDLPQEHCCKRKNASLYAILITSVLFGAGHIFGALNQPLATILCKAIWATGLGVYFGAV